MKWRLLGGGEEDKVEINASGQKVGDTKRLKFGCKLSPRWSVHVETGDGTNGRDEKQPRRISWTGVISREGKGNKKRKYDGGLRYDTHWVGNPEARVNSSAVNGIEYRMQCIRTVCNVK